MTIDVNKTYVATIEMDKGDILMPTGIARCRLMNRRCPQYLHQSRREG